AIERRRGILQEVAGPQQVEPGIADLRQRRQGRRRHELEMGDELPGDRQDQEGRVPDQRRFHGCRLACALIASSRTSPQISSTLSTKGFDLKTCGSVLSNRVSMTVL